MPISETKSDMVPNKAHKLQQQKYNAVKLLLSHLGLISSVLSNINLAQRQKIPSC